MTREEIIRMAREARLGATLTHQGGEPRVWIEGADWHDELERFAALVAEDERDRMISEGWRQCAQGQKTSQFCAVAEQVRQEEREACASLLEDFERFGDTRDCVAAIRARGQE